MIKWIKLISILFLVLSCQKKDESVSFELFEYSATKTLMAATRIEVLSLSNTSGIPLLAINGEGHDLRGHSQKRFCLFFQRPYKKSRGQLWLSFVNIADECAIGIDSLRTIGIEKFSVQFVNKNTHILMTSAFKEKENVQKIPLLNFKEKLSLKYAESEKISGFSPLLQLENNKIKPFKIGSREDSFLKKSAKRCHQVNEDCETVGENLCEFCRYGWYDVVDFACPQGSSKFCGENKCGEKGEPACPSGKKVFGIEGVSLCFDDSEAGFCQGELRPVCNDENILICR